LINAADQFASDLCPVLQAIRATGAITLAHGHRVKSARN
jgi:hypothetical protein